MCAAHAALLAPSSVVVRTVQNSGGHDTLLQFLLTPLSLCSFFSLLQASFVHFCSTSASMPCILRIHRFLPIHLVASNPSTCTFLCGCQSVKAPLFFFITCCAAVHFILNSFFCRSTLSPDFTVFKMHATSSLLAHCCTANVVCHAEYMSLTCRAV